MNYPLHIQEGCMMHFVYDFESKSTWDLGQNDLKLENEYSG